MSKNTKGGLTTKHWLGYMFGDWGGCMTFTLMSSMFTVYCTDCLGVNTDILGTLVIIWTIWDAINDPMMGALMDKAFARKANARGKFRPWLLRATPLLAVTAIALWTVPTFFDGIALLVVLFLCKIFLAVALDELGKDEIDEFLDKREDEVDGSEDDHENIDKGGGKHSEFLGDLLRRVFGSDLTADEHNDSQHDSRQCGCHTCDRRGIESCFSA